MTDKRIYISPPHIGKNEIKYVMQAFESNWIAPIGPNISAFEEDFCRFTGRKHAVAVSSGTAALHLGLIIAGVKPGDLVLCSTFTFAATVNAIKYQGALPIFIDSDYETWNIDSSLLVETIKNMICLLYTSPSPRD